MTLSGSMRKADPSENWTRAIVRRAAGLFDHAVRDPVARRSLSEVRGNRQVRGRLNMQHLYEIGAHTGCGCGFLGDDADGDLDADATVRYSGAIERVPRSFVRCTGGDYGGDPIEPVAARASDEGWAYCELPAPHDPHVFDADGNRHNPRRAGPSPRPDMRRVIGRVEQRPLRSRRAGAAASPCDPAQGQGEPMPRVLGCQAVARTSTPPNAHSRRGDMCSRHVNTMSPRTPNPSRGVVVHPACRTAGLRHDDRGPTDPHMRVARGGKDRTCKAARCGPERRALTKENGTGPSAPHHGTRRPGRKSNTNSGVSPKRSCALA